jgi:hypothetical protein
LGLEHCWILLGAGDLGVAAADGRAMETRLLGIRRCRFMSSTVDIGPRTSATTVVSTTASAILVLDFAGGRWVGNSFAYNRTVSNVDTHVFRNTYDEPANHKATVSGVSYNGGPDGTKSAPTAQERAVAAESHIPPTPLPRQNVTLAARTPALMPRMLVNVNRRAGAAVDRHSVAGNQKPVAVSAPTGLAAHGTAAPPSIGQYALTRVPPSTSVSHPRVAVMRSSTRALTRNTATRQHRAH